MNINMTIIGQLISFIIFVAICMKYIWPSFNEILQERKKKISSGIEFSKLAENKLKESEITAKKRILSGKKEANKILQNATKRASKIIEKAKQEAIIESKKIKDSAFVDINKEVIRSKEELRLKVSKLVIIGVEKILNETIDLNKNQKIINTLASEL